MILKKAKVKSGEEYMAQSYKHSGIYDVNSFVYYVDLSAMMVVGIAPTQQFLNVLEDSGVELEVPEETEKESKVSENLLLKTIALAMNKEKFKDVK